MPERRSELLAALAEVEERLEAERAARRAAEDRVAAIEAELRALRVASEGAGDLRLEAADIVADAYRLVEQVRGAVVSIRERLAALQVSQDAEREMVERRMQALRGDVERTLTAVRGDRSAAPPTPEPAPADSAWSGQPVF